jgi:hypothetical protein
MVEVVAVDTDFAWPSYVGIIKGKLGICVAIDPDKNMAVRCKGFKYVLQDVRCT